MLFFPRHKFPDCARGIQHLSAHLAPVYGSINSNPYRVVCFKLQKSGAQWIAPIPNLHCLNWRLATDIWQLTSGNWCPLCTSVLEKPQGSHPHATQTCCSIDWKQRLLSSVGTSPASLFPTGCTSRTGTLKPSFLRKQIRRVLGFGGCLASQ